MPKNTCVRMDEDIIARVDVAQRRFNYKSFSEFMKETADVFSEVDGYAWERFLEVAKDCRLSRGEALSRMMLLATARHDIDVERTEPRGALFGGATDVNYGVIGKFTGEGFESISRNEYKNLLDDRVSNPDEKSIVALIRAAILNGAGKDDLLEAIRATVANAIKPARKTKKS